MMGISNKKVAIFLSVISVVVLAGLVYYFFFRSKIASDRLDETIYSIRHENAYYESAKLGNPSALQEQFARDVETGINDKFTKSDAYFINHRYFDNGGSVYEIYNYVNSRPSLAFLKEAENIYPVTFKMISEGRVDEQFSKTTLYATLAYMEVLDNHGYADLSMLGTLAGQYAKFAYFTKALTEKFPPKRSPTAVIQDDKDRAVKFALKTRDNMIQVLEQNGISVDDIKSQPKTIGQRPVTGILPRDFLVGLNQYASSLRYLEAAGYDISLIQSPLSAQEIFAYDIVFAKKYVPELADFTAYLDASTLAVVSPTSIVEIRTALQRIMRYKKIDLSDVNTSNVVRKVLNARDDTSTGIDLYNKAHVVMLAKIVPEFKTWLLEHGWRTYDFPSN